MDKQSTYADGELNYMLAERYRSYAGLELDMPLDEGIAEAVHLLRKEGIETIQSCEGGEGHVHAEPAITFCGGPGEGFRAYGIAAMYGLPVSDLRRVWSVVDGELTGPEWQIVFSTKVRRD